MVYIGSLDDISFRLQSLCAVNVMESSLVNRLTKVIDDKDGAREEDQ